MSTLVLTLILKAALMNKMPSQSVTESTFLGFTEDGQAAVYEDTRTGLSSNVSHTTWSLVRVPAQAGGAATPIKSWTAPGRGEPTRAALKKQAGKTLAAFTAGFAAEAVLQVRKVKRKDACVSHEAKDIKPEIEASADLYIQGSATKLATIPGGKCNFSFKVEKAYEGKDGALAIEVSRVKDVPLGSPRETVVIISRR